MGKMGGGDEATLSIDGISVGEVRWFTKYGRLVGFWIELEHSVIRNVRPYDDVLLGKIDSSLRPLGSFPMSTNFGYVGNEFAKAFVDYFNSRLKLLIIGKLVFGKCFGDSGHGKRIAISTYGTSRNMQSEGFGLALGGSFYATSCLLRDAR
jgi:hypothetical protein